MQSYVSFVAEVHEGEILGDHGEDGDEGRLHRVRLDQVPVPAEVAGRIHDALNNKTFLFLSYIFKITHGHKQGHCKLSLNEL